LDQAQKRKKDVEAVRQELAHVDHEVLMKDAHHEGLKREKFKIAMKAKFDALTEYAARVGPFLKMGTLLILLTSLHIVDYPGQIRKALGRSSSSGYAASWPGNPSI
jgi:hypothetical protein